MQQVCAESQLVEYSQFLHQGPELSPAAELLQILSGQVDSISWLLTLRQGADLQEASGSHLTLLLLHARHQPLQYSWWENTARHSHNEPLLSHGRFLLEEKYHKMFHDP